MVAARPITTRANPVRSPAMVDTARITSRTRSNQFIRNSSGAVDLATGQARVGLAIFLAGFADHFVRQRWSRRLFVPVECFQIISHVLFIERELCPARPVGVGGPIT